MIWTETLGESPTLGEFETLGELPTLGEFDAPGAFETYAGLFFRTFAAEFF
jgi:hypothetical protein